MKVLFDISLACHFDDVTHHGGGDFTKRHLLDMLEYPAAKGCLELFSLKKSSLDESLAPAVAAHHLPHHVLDSIHQLPSLIKERRLDRIYSACANTFRGLKILPCRSLLTIHGLRLLEKPRDRYEWCIDGRTMPRLQWLAKTLFPNFYRRFRLRDTGQILSMQGDLFVAADSLHTKYAIARFYPWYNRDRIHVFYPPALIRSSLVSSAKLTKVGLDNFPFFLIVSANRWVKNTWRTVHALDRMFSIFPMLLHRVVLAGTIDAMSLGKLNNPERFLFLGYVSEAFLESLYQRAFCLLYLSLNEGFGYPPLDAMKYRTPVIAASTSSISEVCKAGALYVNPYDENEIINRCLQVIMEPSMVQELVTSGINRHAEVRRRQHQDQDTLFRCLFGSEQEWASTFTRQIDATSFSENKDVL